MESREYFDDGYKIVVDVKTLIKNACRLWWLAIALIIGFMVILMGWAKFSYEPLFQANVSFTVETKLLEEDAEVDEYGFAYNKGTASAMADVFPYIISSSIMNEMLKTSLGTNHINGTISATAIENTNIFTISVSSNDAEDSYNIVNAVVDIYPEIARYVIGESRLNVIEEAVIPQDYYNSVSWGKSAMLGILLGACAWLLAVVVYTLLHKTIENENDIQTKLGKHSFGILPFVKPEKKLEKGKVLSLSDTRTGYSESINSIATRIAKDMQNSNDKVILITSAAAKEGKSTVAANLALALSSRNNKVILVDADLFKQHLKKYVKSDLENIYGLVDYYNDDASENETIVYSESLGCDIVTGIPLSGNILATTVLSSEKIGRFIRKLADQYDYVLIDTPASGLFSDASEIARYADMAVFVVGCEQTSVSKVLEGMQSLSISCIRIAGCILNGTKYSHNSYGRYGYGKYGYSRYGYRKYGSDK